MTLCIGVRLLLISTTFWCMVVCVVKFYLTLNNDRRVGNLFLSKLSKTGKPPLYFITRNQDLRYCIYNSRCLSSSSSYKEVALMLLYSDLGGCWEVSFLPEVVSQI